MKGRAIVLLGCLTLGCATGYNKDRPSMDVRIVDGRVLHPDTGLPVDCDLLQDYERRLPEIRTARARAWSPYLVRTNREIGGQPGLLFGLTEQQVQQGIALSRACRGPAAPPGVLPS